MAGVAQAQAWRRQAWRRQARRRQARRGAVGPEADAAHLGWRRPNSVASSRGGYSDGYCALPRLVPAEPVQWGVKVAADQTNFAKRGSSSPPPIDPPRVVKKPVSLWIRDTHYE